MKNCTKRNEKYSFDREKAKSEKIVFFVENVGKRQREWKF